MTPFGEKVRQLRRERNITQKAMAQALGVSPAYLSALEHGHRSIPNWDFLQRVIGYFNIIWDEAEDLQARASMSHPRITIDTAGLSPKATELANRLAALIHALDDTVLDRMLEQMPQEERDAKVRSRSR